MDYVVVGSVIIGFIWFVYAVRKRTKKKTSQESLFEKLINDPRFESDPKFREQALNILKNMEEYYQSEAFLQKFGEKWAKLTGYSSLEESEEAFRKRLDFHRNRLQAKRESEKKEG
jgi:hypothetical protein